MVAATSGNFVRCVKSLPTRQKRPPVAIVLADVPTKGALNINAYTSYTVLAACV
jgi:hypothetical protein